MNDEPKYKIRISMVTENYRLRRYIEKLNDQLKRSRGRVRLLQEKLKQKQQC